MKQVEKEIKTFFQPRTIVCDSRYVCMATLGMLCSAHRVLENYFLLRNWKRFLPTHTFVLASQDQCMQFSHQHLNEIGENERVENSI